MPRSLALALLVAWAFLAAAREGPAESGPPFLLFLPPRPVVSGAPLWRGFFRAAPAVATPSPANATEGKDKRSGLPPKAPTGQLPSLTRKRMHNRRYYDVLQVECQPALDGMERFSCPSPDHTNRFRCIEDNALCDGFIDCPNAEDEDLMSCMFYKTTKAHLDVLAEALLRWARGRY